MAAIILITWCIGVSFLPLLGVSLGKDWYVSHNGHDFPCGSSQELPCIDLRYTLGAAGDGDTVFLDGSVLDEGNSSQTKLYSMCSGSGDGLQSFAKEILLIGQNGQPRVGCGENYTQDVLMEIGDSNSTENCKLTMQNLEIENGVLKMRNCALEIINCTVIDIYISTNLPCDYVTVAVNQTLWFGQVKYGNGSLTEKYFTKPSDIQCNNTDVLIKESNFFQSVLIVQSQKNSSVYVSDSMFSNTEEALVRMGGLRLKYSGAFYANIHLKNCIFENQLELSRLGSLVNLHNSALVITSRSKEEVHSKIVLDNIQFKNNERGLSLIGAHGTVEVNNSLFIDNTAKHAGAGALVFIQDGTLVFDNCSFINNAGGKVRHNYEYAEPDTEVKYDGRVVHVNSTSVFGKISLVGKGGAMRIHRGDVTISNSVFINNSACLAGGSIFADNDARVYLQNTSLESSPVGEPADEGDLVFSRSKAFVVNNVSLIARKANSGPVLTHNGDHWSFSVGSVWVQCPPGYNLKSVNSSAYGLSPDGLRQGHDVDTLQYYCDPCGRGKYSADFGYLNHTLVCSTFAHYHLMVNGDREGLDHDHLEVYDHHKIECLDCPYGGSCGNVLGARQNFWGFADDLNSTISFQHCPENYCCPSDCSRYDECAGHRSGRLCGRCEFGYSDAIFWTKCVPDTNCSPAWYWSLIVVISTLYFLFLLFVPVLNGFVFSKPCGVCLCFHDKIKQSFHSSKTIAMADLDENTENESNHDDKQDDSVSIQTVTNKNPFSYNIYIILIFFYVQDSLLLNVSDSQSKIEGIFQSLVMAFFAFKMKFPFAKEICIFESMTPVTKVLVQFFPVVFVLGIFFAVYSVLKVTILCRSKMGSSDDDNDKIKMICGYLVAGFVLSVLLFYQFLAIGTFQLLNCVSVDSESVLFLDGTITCFQYWQYGILVYAVLCVLPMCVVFLLGPSLMSKGFIQPWQFLFGCICPLPFTIWWLVQTIQTKGRLSNVWFLLNEETKGVVENLRVPFKENSDVCWLGILLSGRLMLVLSGVFILDSVIRLVCMLFICVSLLLTHAIVKPYRDRFNNFIGILCCFSLVVICCVNLVQAFFGTTDTAPIGPLYILMQVLYYIESLLMVWVPCIVVICSFLTLLIRAIALITKNLFYFIWTRGV